MYARLGTSKFIYTNPLPVHHNYIRLDDIKIGNNSIQTDNKKFIISNRTYDAKIERHPTLDFESQFFDKIKVPEQAHVVQRPIAKDGR